MQCFTSRLTSMSTCNERKIILKSGIRNYFLKNNTVCIQRDGNIVLDSNSFVVTAVLLTNPIVPQAVRFLLISLFVCCNTLEHGPDVSRYVAFKIFSWITKGTLNKTGCKKVDSSIINCSFVIKLYNELAQAF